MQSGVTPQNSIGRSALTGIFWSLVTNWGSRLATFVLFVVLARFLTPAQYGVVAAANVVLMFIALVAEFGLGDAIVQRPNLKPEEVNLPFFAATSVSLLAALGVAAAAGPIERWLEVPGLAPVIVGLSGVAPISTIAIFQETIYRRNLAFKALAYRAFIGNLVAGPIAVIAAYLGAGIWSLVILNYLTVGAGMIWMWAFPQWLPSRKIDFESFRRLTRFGTSVVTMRVVDFFTLRLIDYIILDRFGVAVLGLYTVGSRLYQVLIQLLQSGLNNVSLSVLSRISEETERMAQIYIRAIVISGLIGTPVFVFTAATSTELCSLLFGNKWDGVGEISAPLLLLGAVQCVQFLNGPYLSARGRPHLVLYIALFKYLVTIVGLLLVPAADAYALVVAFCLFQLVATPPSIVVICRNLQIKATLLMRTLAVIALCNGAGYAAVAIARPGVAAFFDARLPNHSGLALAVVIAALGVAFSLAFAVSVLVFGRNELMMIVTFARNALTSRRPSAAHA
jgi:O-antigen/teichoic acid export membrane protein